MRLSVGLLSLLLFVIPAQAQLLNADMEDQDSGIFGWVKNWSVTGGGWADHATFARANSETLGEKFAFWSANLDQILGQVSSWTFAPNTTYTFTSWAIGGGNDIGIVPYQIGYLEGGTNIATNFVELATQTYDVTGQGGWALLPGVSYTTGSDGPEIGQPIVVRFGGVNQGGDSDIWVDNASLTPEPASLVLVLLGGLAVLRRR
ncbi:MAG TPA: PEP-CTERM sorting domain-containing protein [Phycisphaerae bacterium]|nr:PEP-CTERM sorting domain-containing protein [Phycisphaerae bacterium]HPZ98392.1 PEP-CTERM sorting domain-containing protein [Phycisphaerae bacterium]HQE28185.1 PEP-CTERM sorting domain-containing protein [Phycisphaerae bacterium]